MIGHGLGQGLCSLNVLLVLLCILVKTCWCKIPFDDIFCMNRYIYDSLVTCYFKNSSSYSHQGADNMFCVCVFFFQRSYSLFNEPVRKWKWYYIIKWLMFEITIMHLAESLWYQEWRVSCWRCWNWHLSLINMASIVLTFLLLTEQFLFSCPSPVKTLKILFLFFPMQGYRLC